MATKTNAVRLVQQAKIPCRESFYEYDVTKFARGTAEDLAKTYVALLTEMK